MIDIGVNLASSQFTVDCADVIARARSSGMVHMVLTGTSVEGSEATEKLQKQYPDLTSFTAGVHPHYAKTFTREARKRLNALWANPACVAVGECGLDYARNLSAPHEQRHAFRTQLVDALSREKPVFLHCRDAFDDFYSIVRHFTNAGGQGVVHCFTGNRAELDQLLDLGLHIGITGWVTDKRRGGELRQVVPRIPADRLHLETDAPYLTPQVPGQVLTRRNEPSNLAYVAQAVAQLRDVSVESLIAQCNRNSTNLFRLPVRPAKV